MTRGSIFGELAFHPVQAILDNDLVGMIGRFLPLMENPEVYLKILTGF